MTIQTQERYFALPCMKWLLAFPLAATTEIGPRCDFEVVQAVLGCQAFAAHTFVNRLRLV